MGGDCTAREAAPILRAMPRPVELELLVNRELYQRVVLERLMAARESVWIATANVKAMFVEQDGQFVSVVEVLSGLAKRGVDLRLLHAELPSRPFRAAFDKKKNLVAGALGLRLCPRVHFKAVLVDGGWLYLGSANLTGAGLGAKGDDKRNFEVGFGTEDFELIDRTTALFESVWDGRECATCALFDVCPDPQGKKKAKPRRGRRGGSGGVELGRSRRIRLPGR